jgi:hypothetical protein
MTTHAGERQRGSPDFDENGRNDTPRLVLGRGNAGEGESTTGKMMEGSQR